jgi:hypothetical protein
MILMMKEKNKMKKGLKTNMNTYQSPKANKNKT